MTEAKGPRRLLGLRRDTTNNNHAKQQQLKRNSRIAAAKATAVQDDLDDAPDLPPASPGTPPKKTWEKQYRNFLSRSKKTEDLPSRVPPPALALDTPKNSGTAALLKQNAKAQAKQEGSVRGGKFFGPLFRGSHDGSSTLTPPVRRRVKSLSGADELSSTMRKGVEKGSPHSTPQTESVRCISASALSQLSMTGPTPPLRPRVEEEEADDSDDWTLTDSERSDLSLTKQLMAGNAEAFWSLPPRNGMATAEDPLDRSTSVMKRAFTEFHNSAESGSDAVSAYLGDDSSLRDASLYNHQQHHHVRSLSMNGGLGLPQVLEGLAANVVENRVLRPLVGTEKWQTGRRYLIGPAALASASHSAVTQKLWGEATPVNKATDNTSRFGTVLLGKCFLCYGSPERSQDGWSSACLVLKQNYLLEFDSHHSGLSQPRGYAHLQYAVAYPHAHYGDIVELHFYGSPCAKSDKRILLIRVQDATQVDAWRALLNRAASLTLEDVYDIEPTMLGKGQYSTVHKATRRGKSSQRVAVKLFDKNQFWRLVVKGVERADTLVRECAVQATLTSRRADLASFIHLRGFLETADHIVLEMEYLDGTDLFKHISHRGVLAEPEAARILAELLHVVVAMNDVGLSHRDIKPANVLMCRQATEDTAQIKLCDFGMATFCSPDGLVRGRCGTPGYVAPEIFTAGLHGGYGNKVDIFSAGVTLYVMLCGYEPFYGTSDEELIEANKNAELEFPDEEWSTVSKPAVDLVKSMMAVDPQQRPSALQVLADPWIRAHTSIHTTTIHTQGAIHTPDSCLIL